MWPDGLMICLISGHFKQWEFAQYQIKFAKVSSNICQILMNPFKMTKNNNNVLKWQNFVQSGHTAPSRESEKRFSGFFLQSRCCSCCCLLSAFFIRDSSLRNSEFRLLRFREDHNELFLLIIVDVFVVVVAFVSSSWVVSSSNFYLLSEQVDR